MKLVLGTRKSKLALAQARAYCAALVARCRPEVELAIEEVHVVTSGDRFQDRSLQDIGGKGLFIKEVEEALLDRSTDFAVHSIKDVPAELAPGLVLAAVPEREDARDVVVTRDGRPLAELKQGARLGTSSLRRRAYLSLARPDLEVLALRGNVDTRLRKLEEGQIDAIVLAAAGLRRLGLGDRATEHLPPELCLPAVGQGALGIECRADDERVRALLARTDHGPTRLCVTAERAVMAAVGGSCHLPVAAYGLRVGQELWLRAMLAEADGTRMRTAERRAPWPEGDLAAAEALGRALGEELARA